MEPIIKFRVSFSGPGIEEHSITMFVTKPEHLTRASLEEPLERAARAALKSLAFVCDGCSIEGVKEGKFSDEELQAALQKFGWYEDS